MVGSILRNTFRPFQSVFETGSLAEADIKILTELNLNRFAQLDGFFQFLSNSVSYIAWGLPVILLVWALAGKQSHLLKRSLFLLTSIVFSSIITLILKYVIDRPRPFQVYDFIEKLSPGGSPSFPSGHTSDAFALAIALCFAYPRWYIITPALLWAAAVGYSRMALGVHYPSDVLAGAVIGLVSASIWFKVFRRFN